MGRIRKPVVEVENPEIVFTPGMPLIVGKAPRARSLSSAFLAKGQEHFEAGGHDIWQIMHDKFPIECFWGLIALAKVFKIETGAPEDFDRPATREEALDRLERTAGPHARKMLERFLDRVGKAEAKYLEETENKT
jgi:hypothetical protein